MEGELQQRFPFEGELDTEQLRIVFADADGELVIGGLAGTGKTAAALHRAAYLCSISPQHKNKPSVLFLCFNKALAAAVRKVLATFAEDINSRIEVRNIDKWCRAYFDTRNKQRSVVAADKKRIEIIFQAMREVQRSAGEHAVFRRDRYWFLNEIRLIKGCGYTQLQQYLDHHVATGSNLSTDDLRTIFQVAETYDELLWDSDRIDFDDYANIVLQVRDSQSNPRQYDHVIVDEAQDLSASQLELVRSLARRSLTMIADRQQAIYSFRQHPDSLPSTDAYDVMLNENYRSSAEIAELSRHLQAGTHQTHAARRTGDFPRYHHFRFVEDEAASIANQVNSLLCAGVADTEIAVLVSLREIAGPIRMALEGAGIQIAVVDDNSRLVSPGVSVTTVYQAKGREFDAVFVPGLIEGVLPRLYPEMDNMAQEMELARSRRLLGVAMTRARRHLFLSSAEGRPSRYVYELGLEPAVAQIA